jgi:hypothetical protein
MNPKRFQTQVALTFWRPPPGHRLPRCRSASSTCRACSIRRNRAAFGLIGALVNGHLQGADLFQQSTDNIGHLDHLSAQMTVHDTCTETGVVRARGRWICWRLSSFVISPHRFVVLGLRKAL